MRRTEIVVLRASALWAAWVWAVLIRNMAVDHADGAAFRLVHLGLAVVSIAFAVLTWRIAGRAARARRVAELSGSAQPAPRTRIGAPSKKASMSSIDSAK